MQLSTNIQSLTALRQPTKMGGGQGGQKLVFIYPLLVDAALNKYADLVRDFLSVEFISQIKISNGLNITSKLSKLGTVGIGDNAINPAVEIRKSFNFSVPKITDTKSDNDYELYKYQQKINDFAKLFKQQISINPIYSQYSPVVSTIVADENMLVFPLIVGTKAFPVDSLGIFYILSSSIILDLSLNSLGNFEHIMTFLKNSDLPRFTKYFTDTDKADDKRNKYVFGLNSFSTIRNNNANQNTNKLFKIPSQDNIGRILMNFRKVLNLDEWNAESDHLMNKTSTLSADSVPIIQTATQKRHFENAMASFNAYISESIIPILYGMETILGPTPTHINYQLAVQKFVNAITKNMDRHYIETAEHIRIKLSEMPPQTDENGNPIYNLSSNISDKFDSTQFRINDLKSICRSNVEIADTVKKILYNDLVPNLKINAGTDSESISKFADAIVQSAAKLQSMANTIENWAVSAIPDSMNSSGNFESKLNSIKELFRTKVNEFFEDGGDYAIYDPNVPLQHFNDRYSNFSTFFCNQNQNPTESENKVCSNVLKQVITVIKQAMGDILYFLFIWNFMSYICGYVDEIDIDIEIQKKDVLDFPNYTLIVPIEIFKYLYTYYTSARLKRFLKTNTTNPNDDPELAKSTQQITSTFIPNASTIKMMQILNDRLKVPNIVVIDEHKDEMCYQFMFMSRPNKVKLSALGPYIKSQKDIIVD